MDMVKEVRRQLNDDEVRNGTKDPDYKACIRISTNASLREMIGPGILVILTPILTGFLFGRKAVAGILPGSLISAVQMAISSSNSGGAWDNAKKFFEADGKKGTDEHHAAVVGDTVGDPLKDTSGPSLNILIKLMSVVSLVMAPFLF
jgi:inorganic pyrophosphatase